MVNVMKPFNIFSGLRAAGPLGPKLVNKVGVISLMNLNF